MGGIDGVVSDWNLDPETNPKGPHADPTIKFAKKNGIPVFVQTGTDDSTGKLDQILKDSGGLVVKHEKEGTISALSRFFRR